MTAPSDAQVAAMNLAEAVLRAACAYRDAHHRDLDGEIHLSLADAQLLADDAWRRQAEANGGYAPRHEVHDGSTGSLWGRPFRACQDLKPGQVFIGIRVTTT